MNKTAVEDFHRAYELNPNDPRILATWILRLSGQERVDAIKRYEAMVAGDPTVLQELRQRAEFGKALNGREVMALASPYKAAEVPLEAFVSSATHMRTFGLAVMVNGKPARLVLGTGASGIVLSHPAAERVGLAHNRRDGARDRRQLEDDGRISSDRGPIPDRGRGVSRCGDQRGGPKFCGDRGRLIGSNVLAEFLITLDFAGGKLRLNPLPGYHPGEEFSDRVVSPQMESATRVFRFGHLLLVPARVGNAANRLFVLDAGAASTLISYELAAAVSNVNRDDKMALRGLNGRVGDIYQTGNLVPQFARIRAEESGDDGVRYVGAEPSVGHGDFRVSGAAGAGLVYAND